MSLLLSYSKPGSQFHTITLTLKELATSHSCHTSKWPHLQLQHDCLKFSSSDSGLIAKYFQNHTATRFTIEGDRILVLKKEDTHEDSMGQMDTHKTNGGWRKQKPNPLFADLEIVLQMHF